MTTIQLAILTNTYTSTWKSIKTQPHTHARRTNQPCTPTPNMPTLRYLDKHQSAHPSYALTFCSFPWLTAALDSPQKDKIYLLESIQTLLDPSKHLELLSPPIHFNPFKLDMKKKRLKKFWTKKLWTKNGFNMCSID